MRNASDSAYLKAPHFLMSTSEDVSMSMLKCCIAPPPSQIKECRLHRPLRTRSRLRMRFLLLPVRHLMALHHGQTECR